MLRFSGVAVSHAGLVRSGNEDSGFLGPTCMLVADGASEDPADVRIRQRDARLTQRIEKSGAYGGLCRHEVRSA